MGSSQSRSMSTLPVASRGGRMSAGSWRGLPWFPFSGEGGTLHNPWSVLLRASYHIPLKIHTRIEILKSEQLFELRKHPELCFSR